MQNKAITLNTRLVIVNHLTNRTAQGNCGVFNRVVLIYLEVTIAGQLDIDQPVTGDLIQHVVEEVEPGRDVALARSVQIHPRSDFSLLRIPFYFAGKIGSASCREAVWWSECVRSVLRR